MIPRIILKRPD